MNINRDKYVKLVENNESNFIDAVALLDSCEIKPVDRNECSEPKEANKTMTNCAYCVNNPHFENNFKPKTKEWYEKPESFPCLCWISNVDKNPSDYISVIDRHHKENRGLGAFSLVPGGFVKFATPLTKEEVLNYCVGEK